MELLRALATFGEPPGPHLARLAATLGLPHTPSASDYADALVLQLPPYASIYLGPEGLIGGEARDRIAGFWRAMGEPPPDEPDHLTVMVSLHARLVELEAAAGDDLAATYRSLRRAHLSEHLASWLPAYLTALRELAEPYRPWCDLLRSVLELEAGLLGPLSILSGHLAAAPGLADPRREGAAAFMTSLLAPARSGLLLTRDVLGRAADDLGVAVNKLDRRAMLQGLLEQQAAGALTWLAQAASAWGTRHMALAAVFGASPTYWADRARESQALLSELSAG